MQKEVNEMYVEPIATKVWRYVAEIPNGRTFTSVDLRKSHPDLGTRGLSGRVSTALFSLGERGVIKRLNKGDFRTPVVWEVVDNSKKPREVNKESYYFRKRYVIGMRNGANFPSHHTSMEEVKTTRRVIEILRSMSVGTEVSLASLKHSHPELASSHIVTHRVSNALSRFAKTGFLKRVNDYYPSVWVITGINPPIPRGVTISTPTPTSVGDSPQPDAQPAAQPTTQSLSSPKSEMKEVLTLVDLLVKKIKQLSKNSLTEYTVKELLDEVARRHQ